MEPHPPPEEPIEPVDSEEKDRRYIGLLDAERKSLLQQLCQPFTWGDTTIEFEAALTVPGVWRAKHLRPRGNLQIILSHVTFGSESDAAVSLMVRTLDTFTPVLGASLLLAEGKVVSISFPDERLGRLRVCYRAENPEGDKWEKGLAMAGLDDFICDICEARGISDLPPRRL